MAISNKKYLPARKKEPLVDLAVAIFSRCRIERNGNTWRNISAHISNKIKLSTFAGNVSRSSVIDK